MAFIVIDENSAYTTCWALFITVNVLFALLEYFLFCLVSDTVRLQVLFEHDGEDIDARVNRWRLAFLLGVAMSLTVTVMMVLYLKRISTNIHLIFLYLIISEWGCFYGVPILYDCIFSLSMTEKTLMHM